jgi:hypothetical protein
MQQHILPEAEEAIRARAYQFWLDEGRPDGRAEIHWQRALASLSGQGVPPVSSPPKADAKAAPKSRAKSATGKAKPKVR